MRWSGNYQEHFGSGDGKRAVDQCTESLYNHFLDGIGRLADDKCSPCFGIGFQDGKFMQ